MTEQSELEPLLRRELAALTDEATDLERADEELERRRHRNTERQRAIRVLLGEGGAAGEPGREGDLASASFREAWRAVLADHPEGLRPAETANEMTARGYSDSTATPLATRISNDLSRQARRGKLEKLADGRYRLLIAQS